MRDAALAEGILGGTIDFKVLWDEYWDRVYHWLCKMVGNANDAEDLTLCVFVRAWQRLGQYDATKSSLCTWLHLMTTTVAMSSLRKRRLPTVSLDELVGQREPTCDGPEAEHKQSELWHAVDKLPEPERDVLSAHFHDGLTLPEVAQLLGVSLRTAKFHNARGLVLLKGRL